MILLPNSSYWDWALQKKLDPGIFELHVLGQGLGVDFTFALDNNNNDKNNPHLNIVKG